MHCSSSEAPALIAVLHIILMVIGDVASMALWKTQLYHFRRWKGHYVFGGKSHVCSINVQSVQADDSEGAVVMFQADDTHLDMIVDSTDDIRIVFRQETKYTANDHFYDEFEFVVELQYVGRVPLLIGNITKPASSFSTIRLQSEKTGTQNHTGSSGLSVGLAVGISICLFIVCMVIGIIILRWGIRKGYLRHVARSYKNFRNPSEGAASFDNTQSDARESNASVHI